MGWLRNARAPCWGSKPSRWKLCSPPRRERPGSCRGIIPHPPLRACPPDHQGASLAPHSPWSGMSVALRARSCHSSRRPKSSVPLGRKEARLVAPQGTSVPRWGKPPPHLRRLSVPTAAKIGLGQGRTTMLVSFLHPISQAHSHSQGTKPPA